MERTNCVQSGYTAGNGEHLRGAPDRAEHYIPLLQCSDVAALFDLDSGSPFYAHVSVIPTAQALEEELQHSKAARPHAATASGMSAILVVINICQAGDHIISSSGIYGGTFNLFSTTLKKARDPVHFRIA